MFDTDVFVIGGGPAGLAAAIAAARNGLRATVADGCRFPIDKACGEGLMPDSLASAAKLGIVFRPEDGHTFAGTRFVRGAERAEARFRRGPALGIRRTVLHRALVEHAEQAGVHLMWETPVAGIDGNQVLLNGGAINAKWIVGADGDSSRVRKWAGLENYTRNRVRFAFRRHYAIAPWTEFMEVYWAHGAQLYVTPVAHDEICLATISYDPHLRMDDALELVPELRERLEGAEFRSQERGATSATRRLCDVQRGFLALIGDASGSVDAITGEGLGVAFRQAEALGRAMAAGDLSLYQSAHRRILRHPTFMADLLLAMDRWPWAGARAIRAFQDSPGLFDRLLAVHLGEAPPLAEAATHAQLGWRILCG